MNSLHMQDIDEFVLVVDYDPQWPWLFLAERARVQGTLGEIAARIEHFGSTAVPDMAGKPVIDLLVGVTDVSRAHPAISRFQAIGYENFGGAFVPGRIHLRRRGPPHFSITMTGIDGPFWATQIMVREYLRAHRKDAEAYAQSKRAACDNELAMFSGYSLGKAAFLTGLIARARLWHQSQAKNG